MNVEWCIRRLDIAQQAVDNLRRARSDRDTEQVREFQSELELALVPVRAIADHLFEEFDWGYRTTASEYLVAQLQRIRVEVLFAQEIEQNLQPTAPQVSADRLHPWVWDGASSLWASGHYADAVSTAAKLVNAQLQNKIGRRDISDADLCTQCFRLESPQPSAPRLRFLGDRSSETWRSRQLGAQALSLGAFTAIRNPLAHEGVVELGEHEALEFLAVFSVLARWIDECEVDTAEETQPLIDAVMEA